MKYPRKLAWEQIPEILHSFNFELVHSVMTLMDWQWITVEGVPTVEELHQEVLNQFRRLIDDDEITGISFGGFNITKRNLEDEGYTLTLEFILEQSHSHQNL